MTRTNAPAAPTPFKRKVELVRDAQVRPGWRLRFYDTAAQKQRERVFYGSLREATMALHQFRLEVGAATEEEKALPEAMVLGDWVLRWLDQEYRWQVKPVVENPGVLRDETTWINKKNLLCGYVLPTLQAKLLTDLTHQDVYDMIAGLRVSGGTRVAAPRTKKDVANAIRILLAAAQRAGHVVEKVADGLPESWGQVTKKDVVPSLEKVRALEAAFEQVAPGRGGLITVLVHAGLRWSELSALEWRHIDFDRRSIHVERARPTGTGRMKAPKTVASSRYVPMLDDVCEPLLRLREYASDRNSQWVTAGERGGALTYGTWRNYLSQAKEKSQVTYTAHDMRHIFVSQLLAGDIELDAIIRAVGHASPDVSRRVYEHAWRMNMSETAARLSGVVRDVEDREAGARWPAPSNASVDD